MKQAGFLRGFVVPVVSSISYDNVVLKVITVISERSNIYKNRSNGDTRTSGQKIEQVVNRLTVIRKKKGRRTVKIITQKCRRPVGAATFGFIPNEANLAKHL